MFKAQYEIHMDPRTAYQRCHELPYNQFGSVQGLMSAMRDYQRMAPGTYAMLESILWNKVCTSQLTTRDKGNHSRLSARTIAETVAC